MAGLPASAMKSASRASWRRDSSHHASTSRYRVAAPSASPALSRTCARFAFACATSQTPKPRPRFPVPGGTAFRPLRRLRFRTRWSPGPSARTRRVRRSRPAPSARELDGTQPLPRVDRSAAPPATPRAALPGRHQRVDLVHGAASAVKAVAIGMSPCVRAPTAPVRADDPAPHLSRGSRSRAAPPPRGRPRARRARRGRMRRKAPTGPARFPRAPRYAQPARERARLSRQRLRDPPPPSRGSTGSREARSERRRRIVCELQRGFRELPPLRDALGGAEVPPEPPARRAATRPSELSRA